MIRFEVKSAVQMQFQVAKRNFRAIIFWHVTIGFRSLSNVERSSTGQFITTLGHSLSATWLISGVGTTFPGDLFLIARSLIGVNLVSQLVKRM